jgi:hypothetical protein
MVVAHALSIGKTRRALMKAITERMDGASITSPVCT